MNEEAKEKPYSLCMICSRIQDKDGNMIIDTSLKEIPEGYIEKAEKACTMVGEIIEHCPCCEKDLQGGTYVALIGIDSAGLTDGQQVDVSSPARSGFTVFAPKEVAKELLTNPGDIDNASALFVDNETLVGITNVMQVMAQNQQ